MGLLTSVEDFEDRYHSFTAETADKASDWISSKHVNYVINPIKESDEGPFVNLAQADIGDFSLIVYRWNAALESISLADSNRYCICLPLGGQAQTVDTHFGLLSPKPNQARIFRRDAGTMHIAPSDHAAVLTFMLPADLLEARAHSYFEDERDDPLRFSPMLDLESAQGQAVVSLIDHLQIQLSQFPEALENPLVKANLKEHIVTTFLGGLQHNYHDARTVGLGCAIPKVVRRAEDFMRAHADQPLTMQTLAREAGCSERTLQNSFRMFRHKSPMAVLREIRLEKARHELEKAADTVTRIAFKWGFSNLGRFAAQYSEKYGERPCETARIDRANR